MNAEQLAQVRASVPAEDWVAVCGRGDNGFRYGCEIYRAGADTVLEQPLALVDGRGIINCVRHADNEALCQETRQIGQFIAGAPQTVRALLEHVAMLERELAHQNENCARLNARAQVADREVERLRRLVALEYCGCDHFGEADPNSHWLYCRYRLRMTKTQEDEATNNNPVVTQP